LYFGLELVLQDAWNADRAVELIERERCSYTLAATTFLTDLIAAAERSGRDVSSLTRFGCGGAPVPPEVVRAGADADINVLITNLRALHDDSTDTTPPWQAHQTDLGLMRQYQILSGKVVMVSLIEQTARFYENGVLVYWSYVTTGRQDLPTPPGLHYAMERDAHIEFRSSAPKGSPDWYAPTPINYAVLFANYGFFLHDAWWRYQFGPGSNLPHWDPLAFNGGSHGCVNFPEDNMLWVYNWTDVGTPVVVY